MQLHNHAKEILPSPELSAYPDLKTVFSKTQKPLILLCLNARFANNILQYAHAKIMAEKLGAQLVVLAKVYSGFGQYRDDLQAYDLFDEILLSKGIAEPVELVRDASGLPVHDEKIIAGSRLDFGWVKAAYNIRAEDYAGEDLIVLYGYPFRYEYFQGYKKAFKQWLAPLCAHPPTVLPEPKDVVMHVRGTDATHFQWGADYYFSSMARYDDAERVLAVTDDPNGALVQELKRDTRVEVVSGQHPFGDFRTIMQAKRIVMSVSTFSWVASWLSDADAIVMPVEPVLMLNRRHNFIVSDEMRYFYHIK